MATAGFDPPHGSLDVNAAGEGLLVWSSFDDALWARDFRPTSGWGAARQIGQQDDQGLKALLADDGSAIALWKGAFPDHHLRAVERPSGGEWGAAHDLSERRVEGWVAAMDPRGSALAVWGEDFAYDYRRFTLETGWLAAASFVTGEAEDPYPMNLLFASPGRALGLFLYDQRRLALWSFDDTALASVRPPLRAETAGASGVGVDLELAVGSGGHAMAAWVLSRDEEGSSILTARINGGSWGTIDRIRSPLPLGECDADPREVPFSGDYQAKLAVDPNGGAIAVWVSTRCRDASIWWSRLRPAPAP